MNRRYETPTDPVQHNGGNAENSTRGAVWGGVGGWRVGISRIQEGRFRGRFGTFGAGWSQAAAIAGAQIMGRSIDNQQMRKGPKISGSGGRGRSFKGLGGGGGSWGGGAPR